MNAVIVDIQGKYAAALDENGSLVKIPNVNYTIGQTIELHELQQVRKLSLKKMGTLAAAAALALCIGTGTVYALPYGTVNLEADSAIEYTINRFDRVLNVRALNEEGEVVLSSLNEQKLLYRRRTAPISGHDTYVALIAYWLGEVVYDPWAGINYRQTGGNLSITGVSRTDWFMKNLLFLKKRMTVRSNIHEKNAREVLRQYEKLYPEELSELHRVADYRSSLKNRFLLLTDRKFKDFSLLINVFNDFLILAGKL